MSNIYTDFLDRVMSDDLLWSCFSTYKSRLYSAINPTDRLLINFWLNTPVKWREDGELTRRKFGVPFDMDKHYHYYQVVVHDPAFRWGRRRIMEISADKHSPLYEFLKEHHRKLEPKAHHVSKERPFDSRLSGVREALLSLTNADKSKEECR